MRVVSLALVVGSWVMAVGCGGEPKTSQAADSVKAAPTVATMDSAKPATGAGMAKTGPTAKAPITVKVTEQTPGLLAQAKILPIDAQHIAQGKYPEGAILSGEIGRRTGDLIYTFHVQQNGVPGTELVMVNAIDGSIMNTIHQDAEQPKTKPVAKKTRKR